jgi:SAM-dependent methyltransferase
VGLLKKFMDANIALSWATTPQWLWEGRAFAIYPWVAKALLGNPNVKTVADVGGGRTWHMGDEYLTKPDFKLIGIDVDPEELALNSSLDERIATDSCKSFGVPDGTIDLIVSRATVEHLPDTRGFLRNSQKALSTDGKMVVVFANKWAPPMVLNRMLGNRIGNALLLALVPGTKGYGGFKAHYDLCTYGAFKKAAEEEGFEIEYGYYSCYSSSYFQFFFPLHCLSILGDMLRQLTSLSILSSMSLFVLKKRNDGS